MPRAICPQPAPLSHLPEGWGTKNQTTLPEVALPLSTNVMRMPKRATAYWVRQPEASAAQTLMAWGDTLQAP